MQTHLGARLRSLGARRERETWTRILERGLPPRRSADGPRVLCATSVGGHPVARVVDSLVAMALWLRGAEPAFLLCDGALPACEACAYVEFGDPREFVRRGPQPSLCPPCFATGREYYRPLPLPLRRYREFLAPPEAAACEARARAMSAEECFTFTEDGLRLGEQARAGALRFFGKATLESEPRELVEGTARRYAAGAMVAALVARRVLERLQPECLVAHHGVYVPQGVLGEVARREGVRVVNWGPSYRNTTVIYSHGDTYHHTFVSEPASLWDDRPLGPERERRLLEYLRERRNGRGDWTWVTPESALRAESRERERLLRELALDPSRPVFGLLTNVLWDAQLYYAGHAFPDMLAWLWAVLDHFAAHPERQLVVRIHPHEIKHGNRQPVAAEIARRYPALPENVKVVPPEASYNTYELMDLCRAVLIYGTKTGVELAPFGMPVVVAGDAWIRGKGLTHDVTTREQLTGLLDRLTELEPLGEHTVERARRYAYHYFFRRMIPLRALDPEGGIPPRITIESVEELAPGADPGLDVVCEGILEGRPFVFDPVA